MRARVIGGLALAALLAALLSVVKVRVVPPESKDGATISKPETISQGVPPLVVPVAGVARASLADNWGDPRGNGLRAHHGTDIMAQLGQPVRAAAPGVVEKLFISAAGGITAYVRSPDRRWSYYYAHFSAYAPGLHEGQRLKVGDLIGFVGDTGNAGAGNYHLHFGLSRMRPQDGWWQGVPIDPYPSLAGKGRPG